MVGYPNWRGPPFMGLAVVLSIVAIVFTRRELLKKARHDVSLGLLIAGLALTVAGTVWFFPPDVEAYGDPARQIASGLFAGVCLSRRIFITCIASWTSPLSFSRVWSTITPSEMYSTSPSREARGLSSFVSAVNSAVAPVDLICWLRAESRGPRPAA